MKRFILLIIIGCPYLLFSQDTIYKHNGKAIVCKINSIKEGSIYYFKVGKDKEKKIPEEKVIRHTYSSQEYAVADKHELVYRNEKIVFTHNFKISGIHKDELYARFKKYMTDPHGELKKSYKSQKPEDCILIAKVVMPSHYETFFGVEKSTVQYSLIFMGDGSNVTLEITDVYISSTDASNSLETWHAHPGHFFKSQIDVLIVDFDELLKEIEKRIKSY